MDLIATIRHAIKKHTSRNRLVLASFLGTTLIVLAITTPDESAHGDRLRQNAPLTVADLADLIQLTTPAVDYPADYPSAIDHLEMDIDSQSWTDLTVQAGDNLSSIFGRVGLSAQELYRVVNSSDDATVLNRLFPGYQLSFYIPEPGQLQRLQVLTSPLEGFVFTRNDSSYLVEPIQRTADIRQVVKQGNISDSLFMAGQRADIPTSVIMGMADIFGGVIDFLMDPREGDEFSIIYEEQYLNGEFIGTGAILGAQFINRGREHVAVRYENTQGEVGFFSPDGESMRKAFLRNPLDVFRISSNFNPNRRHPILNTIRAHRGTDYAAPTGTPVRATADGTVTWAARNGSFGKLIVIEHNGRFESKYAHLNDYADGIKKGSRVRQGQIIGYVGATGGATGPHLHYEFLVDGVHQDPRTIVDQLPQAISLEPSEMQRFREHSRGVLEQFSRGRSDVRLLTFVDTQDPFTDAD
jgi:murein DD-endopeptidase MepM/ murein hydrolase activator NlpD